VHRFAGVVKNPEEPRGAAALNQLADDLVVEEGDWGPRDTLGGVRSEATKK